MLSFAIPGAQWQLVFSDDVINTLSAHVQRGRLTNESVGQLYSASLLSQEITLQIATVLRPKTAGRTRVVLDKTFVDAERRKMFEARLHCVGLWHTHPEPHPHPSSDDLALAEEAAQVAGKAELAGFVFVIVGTAPFPAGLYVGVHDGKRMHRATSVELAGGGAMVSDKPTSVAK
ncbi:JAB domain-containing protein [Paraburkholderia fungorum]|uniref:JAB domain-containing protein n=1 Tax=Paraburkholderia fungorum TaxID=134537 RepID=A0A1H1I568_9BURK|nr:Mov34/MPN/PAD-1 family protein [Paraburkholderia fungorum]SDR32772.1 JAB domain-containing protein [Paraburkholderia fungorum]